MIDLKTILKLAAKQRTYKATNSVIFTGKTAMTISNGLDWIAGVPCDQPALKAPVVVPIEALQVHMAKTRVLVVTPDGLSDGANIVTPFGKLQTSSAHGPSSEDLLHMLPTMPKSKPVTFQLDLDALDRVQLVASRQDIRFYLNGVLFDLTHGALVATDGSRLHLYRNRVPQVFDRAVKHGKPTRPEVRVICPNEPIDFIVNSAADDVAVSMWDVDQEKQGCILFNAPDGFVWVKQPIHGVYPDWQRVVPAKLTRPVWVEMNPVEMADSAAALDKVHKVAKTKLASVQLHLGAQALIANTKNRDRTPMAMTVKTDRPELDLTKLSTALYASFQASFLQDAADCVTAAAQWCLADVSPWMHSLLVIDGDFSAVVMPTRLAVDLASPEAAQVAPAAPEAAQVVKLPRLAKKARKDADSDPVPAAVAAVAAQLVKGAQDAAKKAPRKPRKAPQAAPVAA